MRYARGMRIAVLTFDGFNEIDSFVVSAMLNRVRRPDWKAEITAPEPVVTSMNGVRVERQQPLGFAREADVVVVGSGRRTRDIIADAAIMSELRFDLTRQFVLRAEARHKLRIDGIRFLHCLAMLVLVDRYGHDTEIVTKGRHDPCVGIRAVPIGEAMVACVLADHYLMHRGQMGEGTAWPFPPRA